MLKGILIKSDGDYQVIDYEDSLDFLHNVVGGYIEYVPIKDNICMIINEEGKLKGLDINDIATSLISFNDFIVGNVLIVGVKDGEDISLSDSQIEMLLNKIKGV